MIFKPLFLLLSFAFFSPGAYADSLVCQSLYEGRADLEKAKAASNCYQSALEHRPTDAFELRLALEGALNSANWVYLRTTVVLEKQEMVKRGLDLVQTLLESKPEEAITHYWNAVFKNFDCQLADTGRPLPVCFLREKNTIIALLKMAMRTDSRVNGYGPHRMYGIMLRELSSLSSGDRTASELYLREALQGSPNYSVNTIELARTLISLGKRTEARRILEQLLTYSCMSMNPFRFVECEEDRLIAVDLIEQIALD